MPVQVRTFGTAGEAAAALAGDPTARYFGGGTLIMRALNEGDADVDVLVRATDSALVDIRVSGARVVLGAGATMARILAERELAFLHPVALSIGGPAVRTAATVGGNLYAPPPYGDFAAALLALDATVTIQGGWGGAREVPIEEFFASRARPGQGLATAVAFNRPHGDAFRFRKVSRVRPKGVSVLSIAALLPGGMRAGQVRIAYNGMSPAPMRARGAERALEGRALDATSASEAMRMAADGASPATDAIASAWYRRETVGVHLRRLLLNEPA